jgi:hypothetical protein
MKLNVTPIGNSERLIWGHFRIWNHCCHPWLRDITTLQTDKPIFTVRSKLKGMFWMVYSLLYNYVPMGSKAIVTWWFVPSFCWTTCLEMTGHSCTHAQTRMMETRVTRPGSQWGKPRTVVRDQVPRKVACWGRSWVVKPHCSVGIIHLFKS